jgi:AcrR family transcriptional regulator
MMLVPEKSTGRSVGATIELVAKEAGVGPATVYRHFGSKEGLIAAFAAESTQRRRLLAAADAPGPDARADIERVARAITTALLEERDLMRVVFGDACRDGGSLSAMRQRPVRATHAIAALLRHHMDAGRLRRDDPVASARSLFGMILAHAFITPLLDGTSPPEPETVVSHVVPLFLSGLSTGGHE